MLPTTYVNDYYYPAYSSFYTPSFYDPVIYW